MKFPFVPRARYDLLQHNYDQLRAELHKEQVQLSESKALYNSVLATHSSDRSRYDTLLQQFCAMKLAGGIVPEVVTPRAPKEADAAVIAINLLSSGRPGLRGQMMRQLNADRANPLISEVDIMQRIEMGVVIDEGLPA